MDKRNNDFDFDFRPLGLAIKKAREADCILCASQRSGLPALQNQLSRNP
ncbi:hypothetical protein AALC75_11385 [Lachnospiraceae bacterium 48-42]